MINDMALFSLITFAIGILGLFLLRRYLKRVANKRVAGFKRKEHFTSIPGEAPQTYSPDNFEKESLENISNRFSIIRASLTILVITLTSLLAAIPLLAVVPAAVLSVIAGSLAVVSGIVLRPFVENYISGIIISLNKTLHVGDTIMLNEQYGTIEDITLTSTIVKLWDWRRIIIPNTLMLNREVISYTLQDNYVWAKVEFWVSYETDLKLLRKLAIKSAKKSKLFTNLEEPSLWVMEMGEQGYRCWLATWANSPAEAWEISHEIRSELIMAFQTYRIKSHTFHLGLAKDKTMVAPAPNRIQGMENPFIPPQQAEPLGQSPN